MTYPDIIPYDSWINSQLSIARHYGGITLGDKLYEVDYIFAKENEKGMCFPDLIESKLYKKMQKERKEEVKAHYEKGKVEQKGKFDMLYEKDLEELIKL